jgi:hypothetical protein
LLLGARYDRDTVDAQLVPVRGDRPPADVKRFGDCDV